MSLTAPGHPNEVSLHLRGLGNDGLVILLCCSLDPIEIILVALLYPSGQLIAHLLALLCNVDNVEDLKDNINNRHDDSNNSNKLTNRVHRAKLPRLHLRSLKASRLGVNFDLFIGDSQFVAHDTEGNISNQRQPPLVRGNSIHPLLVSSRISLSALPLKFKLSKAS